MNNFCIIMAGGIGSRFWPLSKDNYPKQFLDILGTGKSFIRSTYERFSPVIPDENFLVVTNKAYKQLVLEHLPMLKPDQVLCEPARRNTAPCIAYAAAVIAQMDPDATVIVSPADHAVFGLDRFVNNMQQAIDCVQENDWIITLGAQPVKPDTSYGYIQFRESAKPTVESEQCVVDSTQEQMRPTTNCPLPTKLYDVVTFTEKPPVAMARQMIASGEFFWNTGLLVWRLPVLQQAYRQFLPAIADTFFNLTLNTSHSTLEQVYSQCEAISVDHGIMEKADNVHVLAARFGWSDVETWDSLYSVFRHDKAGNAIVNGLAVTYDTHNCVVIVPSDKTVVLDGLDGYIVAADEDTLLICRRKNEDKIFKFASDVEMQELLYSNVK